MSASRPGCPCGRPPWSESVRWSAPGGSGRSGPGPAARGVPGAGHRHSGLRRRCAERLRHAHRPGSDLLSGTALAVAAEPVLGRAGYWLMSVTALFATAGATNSGLYPAAVGRGAGDCDRAAGDPDPEHRAGLLVAAGARRPPDSPGQRAAIGRVSGRGVTRGGLVDPAAAPAAAAGVEEREIDDQVDDRAGDDVNRQPLLPLPAVARASGHVVFLRFSLLRAGAARLVLPTSPGPRMATADPRRRWPARDD